MFIIEKVLQITKKIKSINTIKNVQKWLQKCPIQIILEHDRNDMLNNKSNNLNSNCIIIAICSQYLKLKMAEKVAGYTGWPVTREVTL